MTIPADWTLDFGKFNASQSDLLTEAVRIKLVIERDARKSDTAR